MKKVISVISAAAIALTMCAPALAKNNSDDMKTVLASVKERVEIPAECTEFSSSEKTMYGITVYDFSWNTKDDGEYKYVNIGAFSDGTIVEYSTDSKSLADTPRIPSLTREDARERAEEFAKKLNPAFPYELKIKDEGMGNLYGNYSFTTQVYINDIPLEDIGRVTVNGDTGNVQNFSLDYVPTEYPSLDNAISAEAAKTEYSTKLGLKLVYRTYTDDDGNEKAYPAYTQKVTGRSYISVLTGEVTDLNAANFKRNSYNFAAGASVKETAALDDSGFTKEELAEFDKIDGLISKSDIEKQLRSNKTLNIPSGVKLGNIRLYKGYNKDNYAYNLSFSSDDTSIHAALNARTGELLSYYRYDNNDTDNAKAENRDDNAVKALAPDKSAEYEYSVEDGYQRYVNGVPVEGDKINLSVVNGTITYYGITYTEADFPSVDEAISVSDAEKIMFDTNGYDMVYMISYDDDKAVPVAVYKHDYININALTGKVVDYNNEELSVSDSKIEYSDLDTHWSKQIVETLAYYGIGFSGGEFKPNEKITQKDYIQLLDAINYGGEIVLNGDAARCERSYSNAFRHSILKKDERDDNAPVTRETAAVYMMRAIGAEPYAKYDDIYVTPFKDVTRNKGYIALLSAMGIASGNGDGTFTPEREITRAESAVMIYNYLTR